MWSIFGYTRRNEINTKSHYLHKLTAFLVCSFENHFRWWYFYLANNTYSHESVTQNSLLTSVQVCLTNDKLLSRLLSFSLVFPHSLFLSLTHKQFLRLQYLSIYVYNIIHITIRALYRLLLQTFFSTSKWDFKGKLQTAFTLLTDGMDLY